MDFAVGQKVEGVVLSFNGTWGWVEVDGVARKLFAHYRNIVSAESYRTLVVGQRVSLEVVSGQKTGFQAGSIEVIAEAGATDEIRHQGKVLKYFADKRYGWLTSKAGRIFFHLTNCRYGTCIADIPWGVEATFLIRQDPKHPGQNMAVDVHFDGEPE